MSERRADTKVRSLHPEAGEQTLRTQLAAAYRLVEHFGWSELIYGHLTVRLPGNEPRFLINPYGLAYDEVCASNLVIVDVDGTLLGQHSIKARIFDAEFTKSGNFLWGWLEGSGGLRYARVEQDASWQETGGIEFVVINFDFEGTGPTLALKGGVPLFDSNLSFFAGGRTSLLYGNRSAISSDDTPAGDIITNYDGLLPILEARTGFEWATVIYGYNVFLQAAVEGQTWFRGGAASGGDDEGIPADQLDMGFFGGSFSTIIELR